MKLGRYRGVRPGWGSARVHGASQDVGCLSPSAAHLVLWHSMHVGVLVLEGVSALWAPVGSDHCLVPHKIKYASQHRGIRTAAYASIVKRPRAPLLGQVKGLCTVCCADGRQCDGLEEEAGLMGVTWVGGGSRQCLLL